jgi:hypothetical protein
MMFGKERCLKPMRELRLFFCIPALELTFGMEDARKKSGLRVVRMSPLSENWGCKPFEVMSKASTLPTFA